jgi:phosphoribosylformylglycinamidine cyclo-ligase/phosphoribosylamine--glycine ligase/phosphoribosylformylglycinamidine cyclo-ligase
MHEPVLVASTDGVGTKVKLAAQTGRYAGIGQDIVNHCINDILVQGAVPLFFLDYFATSRLQPQVVAQIVQGMAQACREAGCAILGGETAEMPGVYAPGEFDVAGTIVGVVDRQDMLPREDIKAGDVLVGLRSSGAHTNGFTLIRKVFGQDLMNDEMVAPGLSLADALLAPHRSYLSVLKSLLGDESHLIKALVHITGGGFLENIPRVLPPGLDAVIHRQSWSIPPLFQLIQSRGQIAWEEMYQVFNMGIGMIAIVSREDVHEWIHSLPEEAWLIGELVAGDGKVILS